MNEEIAEDEKVKQSKRAYVEDIQPEFYDRLLACW